MYNNLTTFNFVTQSLCIYTPNSNKIGSIILIKGSILISPTLARPQTWTYILTLYICPHHSTHNLLKTMNKKMHPDRRSYILRWCHMIPDIRLKIKWWQFLTGAGRIYGERMHFHPSSIARVWHSCLTYYLVQINPLTMWICALYLSSSLVV
jgi:hypothetical protein